MNKTRKTLITVAASVLLVSGIVTAAQSTSSSTFKNSGTCFDGSIWNLTLTRSGSKVNSTLTVKPVAKKSQWVVNYAYIPLNTVNHQFIMADKKGALNAKATIVSADKVGVFIMTDNAGVMYCSLYGEI